MIKPANNIQQYPQKIKSPQGKEITHKTVDRVDIGSDTSTLEIGKPKINENKPSKSTATTSEVNIKKGESRGVGSFVRAGFKSCAGIAGSIIGTAGGVINSVISGITGKGKVKAKRIPPGSDLILKPDVQKSTLLSKQLQDEIDSATHSRVVNVNKAILMKNGAESFPERYRMMENAKHSINMQTLIFHSDATGWKTANLLAKKAKEGVKCRLLYDWILSRHSDPKMFKMMKDAGVEVVPFNMPKDQDLPPDSMDNIKKYIFKGFRKFIQGQSIQDLKILLKWIMGKGDEEIKAWAKRNPELADGIKNYTKLIRDRWHMKILSVDGNEAVVGGLNVGSEYALAGSGKVDETQPPGSNSRRSCRDTDVKVEGAVVEDINRTFAENWEYAKGPDPESINKENPPAKTSGDIATRFVSHQPAEKMDSDIENWYVKMLDNCQKTAYIANAYFIPSERLTNALTNAAKRGVDVRIFTNSEKTNNRPLAYHAGRRIYPELLERGVRIYEMTDENFTTLHSKTGVFDGEVSTIGSSNLDPRSFRMHSEDNMVVHNREFALRMHEIFKEDLEMSNEILMEDVKKDSVVQKTKQWFSTQLLDMV